MVKHESGFSCVLQGWVITIDHYGRDDVEPRFVFTVDSSAQIENRESKQRLIWTSFLPVARQEPHKTPSQGSQQEVDKDARDNSRNIFL
jgi:hypothetical protein